MASIPAVSYSPICYCLFISFASFFLQLFENTLSMLLI